MTAPNIFISFTSYFFIDFAFPVFLSKTESKKMSFPLKDSITTWQFIGISLSSTHGEDSHSNSILKSLTLFPFSSVSSLVCVSSLLQGICVSDPLDIIVKKNFFIDLRLPYSAVRGEQLEIKAILHNYIDERVTVSLSC